jgi:hypothetical protein
MWRDGGEEDSGTNTLPTWRLEDLREMAGLWTVEKKAAWSSEMLSVKVISWAIKVLIFLSAENIHSILVKNFCQLLVGLLVKVSCALVHHFTRSLTLTCLLDLSVLTSLTWSG